MTIERVVNGVVYEFPDGTPQATINNFAARKSSEPTKPSAATPPRARPKAAMDNALGSMVQGLTFGFGDEGMARLRSMMPGQGSYEDLLAAEREGLRKYSEESPVVSTLAELGGSILPAIVTGGAASIPTLAAKAPRLVSMLSGKAPSLARSMGYGAGSGAVSAVGTSEKPMSELPGEALTGAAAGATATGALGLAAKYVASPLYRSVKQSLGFGDANKMADIAIAKALEKDGLTVEQAAQRLKAVSRGEMALADLGENTAALLRRSSAAPGQARIETKGALATREAGRIPRVSEDLRTLMSGSKDFYTDVTDLIKKRSDDANTLYAKAWESSPTFSPNSAPGINKLRSTPSFQEAMKGGARRMADQGLDITDPKNTLRALHETKIELDDMIERALTSDRTANQARILKNMKNELLADMEKVSPEYRTARLAFAGDSEMLSAMKEGQRVYQLPEPELRKIMARFSNNPSEYDAFRAGMAQAMLEKLRTAGSSADPLKTIMSKDMDDKLRRAFKDDASYEMFKKRLQEESQMLQTEKSGFRRTPIDTDLDSTGASGVGAATRLMSGSPTGAAIESMQAALIPRLSGMPPRVAGPTAQKLTTPSSSISPVLDSIMKSLKEQESALTNASMRTNQAAAATGARAAARNPREQYPEGEEASSDTQPPPRMPSAGIPVAPPGVSEGLPVPR